MSKEIREYTNKLLDFAEEEHISWQMLAEACLRYMSEDDVKNMYDYEFYELDEIFKEPIYKIGDTLLFLNNNGSIEECNIIDTIPQEEKSGFKYIIKNNKSNMIEHIREEDLKECGYFECLDNISDKIQESINNLKY